jgi:hypothetical protein
MYEPLMDEIIRLSGNGQLRNRDGMLDLLGSQNRSMQPRTLMDNPNIVSLVLNSMIFGENERINGLLHEKVVREWLSNNLGEWPWPRPDPDMIKGPINIGHSMETGAPVGIFPEEVHFFRHRSFGFGQNDACKAHHQATA